MPRRTISQGLLLSISVLALSACSGGQSQGIEPIKSAAPVPPPAITDTNLTASDTLTPVSVTQNLDLPPMAAETAETTMTTVTTSAYPAPVDPAIETRVAKMEEAIGSLRKDYDRIMPAFASLNTTNERIQTLLDQIEVEQGKLPVKSATTTQTTTTYAPERASAAPATISPVTMKPGEVSERIDSTVSPTQHIITPVAATTTSVTTTKTTETVAPSADVMDAMAESAPAQDYPSMVKGVRLGEHGAKTRLVIDLVTPDKPEVVYDLDNTEHLLLIEMPATGWAGVRSGTPKSSPYIDSWTAQKGTKTGSALAIQLKKDAKIVSTQYLKREGDTPARLVVDLGPAT